jgi:hypothetical protein
MIRVLFSLVLAVAVIGAGAASAAHGLAHDAPLIAHDMQDMDAGHATALAECCDATQAKVGGSCFADIVPPEVLVLGRGAFAGRMTLSPYLRAFAGVDPNVPTGPPKV